MGRTKKHRKPKKKTPTYDESRFGSGSKAPFPLPNGSRVYRVLGCDDVLVAIPEGVMQHIKTLKRSIDEAPDVGKEPIPIGRVNSATLEKILEWCDYHKEEDGSWQAPAEERHLVIPKWDFDFICDLTSQQVQKMICASDILGVYQLMRYMCKFVADMLETKTMSEICAIYSKKDASSDNEQDDELNEPGPSTR